LVLINIIAVGTGVDACLTREDLALDNRGAQD